MRQLIIISTILFIQSCETKSADNKKNTINNEDTLTEIAPKAASDAKGDKLTKLEYNCSYDNEVSSLGNGLIIAPAKFDLYNDSLLNNKYASWDMYEDETRINLCSKFFKPDYGIMHFVCIAKSDKAYKVIINASDTKYFPKTKSYDFKTWDEYILQSYGIRRLTANTGEISAILPLRIAPKDNADTLAIPQGYEMFCPMDIKGDWVKVKYDCFYNDENSLHEGEPCHDFIDQCKNPLTGWLRWRQENKLLIDIFLMP